MLLTRPGRISPSVWLLPIGRSAFYAVGSPKHFILIDCGCTAHVPGIVKRLEKAGLERGGLKAFLPTNLTPARFGGAAALAEAFPAAQLWLPAVMEKRWNSIPSSDFKERDEELTKLYPSFSASSDSKLPLPAKILELPSTIPVAEAASLAIHHLPGYTEHSVGFAVRPDGVFISDLMLGFFRGARSPAPASRDSLSAVRNSLEATKHLEFKLLGLPYDGALSGEPAKRHIVSLLQVMHELRDDFQYAFSQNIPQEELQDTLKEQLYSPFSPIEKRDPLFEAIRTTEAERIFAGLVAEITDP